MGRALSKKLGGSSLVEVMIMMLILSVSIVGIYSMVNSGQKLAIITDERRLALNIAREGIEGIGNLRDTFLLRSYSPPAPIGGNLCFFTTNGINYGNCPQKVLKYILNYSTANIVAGTPPAIIFIPGYTLKTPTITDDYTVCVDINGWYNQTDMNPTTPCSKNAMPVCGKSNDTNCRSKYARFITFSSGGCSTGGDSCITATVTVTWGTTPDKKVELEQVFTKK